MRDRWIKAKALIDTPEKWCKGEATSATGARCAGSALVSAGVPFKSSDIIRFNDDPETTHADVMAFFNRTIEQL